MKLARLNLRAASTLACLVGLGLLAGCAVTPSGPTVLVLPGAQKGTAQFQADNAGCQQQAQAYVAQGADAANSQAVANAAVGTAIGAAAGALMGSGYYYNGSSAAWGAGTGLLIGSTVGAGQSQASSYSLQHRYNIAFMQCMYLLGHQVPGQVAARRPASAVRPVPLVPSANTPAPSYPVPSYPVPNYPPPNTPAPILPPPNTPAPVGVVPPA